jgi:hypothetical protein
MSTATMQTLSKYPYSQDLDAPRRIDELMRYM